MNFLIVLCLLLAPTYALRLKFFGLPADVLMLYLLLFWLAAAAYLSFKRAWGEFFSFVASLNKKLLVFSGLLLLAATMDLFFHGFGQKKLGQFLVLFVQPISVFFLAGYFCKVNEKTKTWLLVACYWLLAIMGLYAILQYFTLLGLPQIYWGNANEPKRALSFFSHPNFYALFSAPLLALLIPDVLTALKSRLLNLKSILWLIGALGLLLSMSRAGWLGLGAALALYLFIAADKKIRKVIFSAAAVIFIVVFTVPNLRWRVLLPLYGEKSTVSRFSLWHTGVTAIKESPIFGLGLTGFAQNWDRLNKDLNLTDTHNFPHNIFLDFWVETGVLGLISFIGIVGWYLYYAFKNRKNLLALSVGLFLVALILQGQVDNPYFKNDLALVFWLVLSLAV